MVLGSIVSRTTWTGSSGATPRCSIYDRDGFDRGGVEAKKERRSVTCGLATADPFNATRHMRWRVQTSSTDRAPDKGWFND